MSITSIITGIATRNALDMANRYAQGARGTQYDENGNIQYEAGETFKDKVRRVKQRKGK